MICSWLAARVWHSRTRFSAAAMAAWAALVAAAFSA